MSLLWTFGRNDYGQLGLGDITPYSSPVQVGSLTTWSQVAGGLYFTAAVKTDGTLWTWGRNDYGQLGQGDIVPLSSPVQVGSLTTWDNVACGHYHTGALQGEPGITSSSSSNRYYMLLLTLSSI